MKQKITFKDGFLWGSALSAYQTEGGNDNTDWWAWEHGDQRIDSLKEAGKDPVDYQSGIACDSYNRFDEDFALAEKLHQNSIRISIEWARIEPAEGIFSEEALAHYESVLQSAKAHGLATFVTLHHFTLPLWIARKGGFLEKKNNEHFIAYVKTVATRLHPLVDFWITINEPEIYSTHSYLLGKFPPHARSVWKSFAVVQNLIRAHNQASVVLHQISDTPVGMANQLTDIQAASVFSRPIAVFARFLSTRYVLNRIIKHSDFIGLNYYLRQHISWSGVHYKKYEKYDTSDLGWELYPSGIETILNGLRSYRKPIYITENGLADAKDAYREKFIKDHLFHIHNAIENGADVRGYLHWSLIDNFEWADGFAPRFGLVEIDRSDSLRRKIRPSALVYAEICKTNIVEYDTDPLYIAIDVGGTNIRVGSFSSYVDPRMETSEAFALSHDFVKDFANLLQLIQRSATRPITAIGVALPGNLNMQKNALVSATNLPEWAGRELQKLLADSFHCPVFLENDATTSALGEAFYAKHPFNSFMFMIWGTGIGGTLVSTKPHVEVTDLDHEKYFREIEKDCGGKNLLARYNTTLPYMSERDRTDVLTRFEKHITELSQELSIKNIVLGGGVALNHKDILEPVFRDIQQKSGLTINVTSLGDSGTFGLYGALALIRIKMENS